MRPPGGPDEQGARGDSDRGVVPEHDPLASGCVLTVGVGVPSRSSITSLRVQVRYATVARMAVRKIALVTAVPNPRPWLVDGVANQSPRFAPKGPVRMYASQKDSTAFAPSRQPTQSRQSGQPAAALTYRVPIR